MLLYGMIEADAPVETGILPPGVRESSVETLEHCGVRCLYSQVEDLAPNSQNFRADALRFHRVLRAVMDQATVVPFRFPTLLETTADIREFVAAQSPAYAEDLRRLRGSVQMEVRIKAQGVSPEAQSGREYMDARLTEKRALIANADVAFAASHELIAEWRVQQEARGLRCYALISRDQVTAFEERMRAVAPLQGASVMVSGPWPPSEFLRVRNA